MLIDVNCLISWITYLTILTSVALCGFGVLCLYLYYFTENPNQITFILFGDPSYVPRRGTSYSAGYDLNASESCVVPARSHKLVKTGLKVILPKNTYGRIASRSGLSLKHGIEVGAGVVDEDYRNEIKVILYNHTDTDFMVNEEDRIAQFIVEKIMYPTTKIEDSNGNVIPYDTTFKKRTGGFESTGRK